MIFNLVCDDGTIVRYDNNKNDFIEAYQKPKPITGCPLNFNPPPQNNNKKVIQRLQLVLGYACNYNCFYCSQRLNHDRATGKQDIDNWIRILESIDNDFHVGQFIELWGGEPLLYWKTIEGILPHIKRIWPNLNVFVTTNGSLLTEQKIKTLHKYGVRLQISHDGPAQTIVRNKDDIFDDPEIVDAIKFAAEYQMVTFHPVITKYNCDLRNLWNYLYEKFPTIDIIPEGVVNCFNYNINEVNTPFNEEQQQVFMESFLDLMKVVNPMGGRQYGVWHDIDNFIKGLGYQHLAGCTCYGSHKLVVDYNGDILRCHTESKNAQHRLGNITQPIYFFDKKQSIMHMKDSRQLCNDSCIAYNTCAGSCPVVSEDKFDSRHCINKQMVTKTLLVGSVQYLFDKNVIEISCE